MNASGPTCHLCENIHENVTRYTTNTFGYSTKSRLPLGIWFMFRRCAERFYNSVNGRFWRRPLAHSPSCIRQYTDNPLPVQVIGSRRNGVIQFQITAIQRLESLPHLVLTESNLLRKTHQ